MSNFFLLLGYLLLPVLHPFHVSVCDIEYNEEARSIQVSQRVFLDDLEQALNKRFGINLDIANPATVTYRDSLIQVYMFENLHITVDGKEKKRAYIGNEVEEDGMWCYIEYAGVKKFKSFVVTSTVLLEIFTDQANIIHYKYGDYERSTKLDFNKKSVTFSLRQ